MKTFTKKLVVLLVASLGMWVNIFAQSQTLNGKVTDESGTPLDGVMVYTSSRGSSVLTDVNGNFTINIKDGDKTVTAILMGYENISVPVAEAQTIVMTSRIRSMKDVVIIGYGSTKKNDLTGAVVSVKSKDFAKGQISSPEALLTGKVAGAQLTLGSGAPGDGARIRIRGIGSINASSDPLFVIDGIPVSSTGISGSQNILNTINPNDIASIDVLKDASATAIYGSRAANGVIIITTKHGLKNNKLAVGFSTLMSTYKPVNFVDVLNADEFRNIVNNNGTANDISKMGTSNTDWQRQIYQTAIGMDNNINFTGGIKRLPYRFSFGALNQEGILKTGTFNRYSTNLNLNPTFFHDKLKIDLMMRSVRTHNRFANTNAIGAALSMDPTQSATQGNFDGYWEWLSPTGIPVQLATRNPLGLLNEKTDLGNTKRLIGNIKFDLEILKGFNAVLNLGLDKAKGYGTVYVPENAAQDYTRGGRNNRYEENKRNKLLDFYLKYAHSFNEKHNLDVTGGYSYQDFLTKTPSFPDYRADGSIYNPAGLEGFDQNTLIGFFARLNYNFSHKYYLTGTVRNDYSSKFAPSVRSGVFPSFAAAWRISEENFLKGNKTVSNLKLRFGWGKTGQSQVGNSYNYLPLYTQSDNSASYQFGSQFYNTLRPSIYDPKFHWETIIASNFGFDFGFFNDKFSGSLDFYNRKSKDLINTIPVSAGSIGNAITTNVGDMVNKGFELMLNYTPINKNNFTWNINGNLSKNKNEITKLTNRPDSAYVGEFVGNISGGTGNTIQIMAVGHPVNAFYVLQQVYDANGKPIEGVYVDRNHDGIITNDDRYIYESANPTYTIGLTNTFTYKGFSLAFLLRAQTGNYMYNNVSADRGALKSVFPNNDYLANAHSSYLSTDFRNNQYLSDYYIQNASFLKMDFINLVYNVGKINDRGTDLSFSFNIQNVFKVTKYTGVDPEISGGIDNNFYPRSRTFSFGANLQF